VTYEYSDTVDYGLVISQDPAADTMVAVGSSVDLVVSSGQPVVPYVVGETEPNATAAITAVDNLTVGTVTYEYSDTVGYGLVISQEPISGTTVSVGSSVDLVVSSGQPVVPNVVGMTEPNATTAITAVDNLTVGTVTYEYSDTIAAGLVISQNPSAGTSVLIGSSVDFVVSLGLPVDVPNVVGMSEPNANSAITTVGLVSTVTYEFSDTIPAEIVISQDPVGGTTVPAGSSVNLVVSLGQSVVVPYVVGMSEPNATAAITAVDNLTVGTVTYEYSDTVGYGLVISQNPVGGTEVTLGATVNIVVSLGQPVVPNVVGQTTAAAVAAIEGIDNLTAAATYRHDNTVVAGFVISQNPVGGTKVSVGSTVNIVVSLGRPVVPGVVGLSEAEAVATIQSSDDFVVAVTYEYSDTIAYGLVISQNPASGTEVDVGTTVNLVVSLGQPKVPNVVGKSLADATTAIEAIDNLMVAPIYVYDNNVPFGIVISQNPTGGTVVDIGTTVNIVVSLGQPVVPGVVGMTEPNATTAIVAVDNLTVGTVKYEYSDTVDYGLVISQEPTGGTEVPIGSTVELVISLGQPMVPDVVGKTEPNATAAIVAVDNLTVGAVTYEYSDTIAYGFVITQDPVGGTFVLIGSAVDFVVSLGQPMVPNVVGKTTADANSAITAVDNLTVDTVIYEYNDVVPAGLVISQNPVGGTIVPVGSFIDLVVSAVIAPNAVGMTEPNANSAITTVGLVSAVTYEFSDTIPAEIVISQNPVGGTAVDVGTTVNIVVSSGQPVVPNVVGQTEADANSAIITGGLTVGTVTYEYSDTVAKGVVISQYPAADTTVAVGSPVDLVVSSGQPKAPNVVGMSEPNATAAITAVDNLTVGTVTYEYSDTVGYGLVVSQNPVGETAVPIGSAVDFVVSLGQPMVPNVVGMTEPNATTAIEAIDNLVTVVTYEYHNTVPKDLVISQYPLGGTTVNTGATVNIAVSLGRPVVPDVVGQAEATAVAAIEAIDNFVAAVTYEHHDTVLAGNVISQTPVGGTAVDIGTTVNIVVSLGPSVVPNVVGKTEPNATAAITAAGLIVGTVTYEDSETIPAGLVISQNPIGETTVPVGSPVDLIVSAVIVPNVVGMTKIDARSTITADDLIVGIVAYEYSDTVPAGFVISQNPVSGMEVPVGSSVDLVVS